MSVWKYQCIMNVCFISVRIVFSYSLKKKLFLGEYITLTPCTYSYHEDYLGYTHVHSAIMKVTYSYHEGYLGYTHVHTAIMKIYLGYTHQNITQPDHVACHLLGRELCLREGVGSQNLAMMAEEESKSGK